MCLTQELVSQFDRAIDSPGEFIARIRWPQGFVCPRAGCRSRAGWKRGGVDRPSITCRQCRQEVSATAGTPLAGIRQLRPWLLGGWAMVCLPRTLNAREVARWLGVGARTASRMLEVHRRAMSDLASDELAAQIDQTLVKEGGLWRPYVTSAVPSIDLTRWVKSGWPRGYAPDEFPDMSIAKPLRELVFKYARRHSPREEVFCEVITRILSAQESSDT